MSTALSVIIAFFRNEPIWLIVIIWIVAFIVVIAITTYYRRPRKEKSDRETILAELEDATIKFRQISEQMFEDANKCTLQEYEELLKDSQLLQQHDQESKQMTIITTLMPRQINPKLQKLQDDNKEWRGLKTKMVRLGTEIGDGILIGIIESYILLYPRKSSLRLLNNLEEMYSGLLNHEQHLEVRGGLDRSDIRTIKTYHDIVRRIKTLQFRERILRWLKIT